MSQRLVKKIGFFGNTNNYSFMLARAFKKKGYEIEFIVDSKEKLHRPEGRYSDITLPYPNWITDISPCDLFLVNTPLPDEKLNLVKEKFSTCDLIFLTGFNIRFYNYFKAKHICILSGSDLTNLADYSYAEELMELYLQSLISNKKLQLNSYEIKAVKSISLFKMVSFIYKLFRINFINDKSWFMPRNYFYNLYYLLSYKYWLFNEINRQRNSIKNASGFIYSPIGLIKDGDKLLNEINVDNSKRILAFMIDTELSIYSPPIKNEKIRIFNVARFNWVTDKVKDKIDFSQLDSKGNDIMIKGLGLFYHKYKIDLDIIFVKKGNDINETKELLKSEKVDHLVTWIDELSQAEVQKEYRKADIVFDQFANSIVSMGGLDAMATGRPLVANARAEIFDKVLGEKTQICDAKSPEDICKWLELLVLDENFRIKKGIESREFVIKHYFSENVITRLETYFLKNKI